MSDKPKDEKPAEQEAPKPLTDEQTYTTAAASDPRVTGPAETEEEAKKREEDAKKPPAPTPAAPASRDDKSKSS